MIASTLRAALDEVDVLMRSVGNLIFVSHHALASLGGSFKAFRSA